MIKKGRNDYIFKFSRVALEVPLFELFLGMRYLGVPEMT